MTKEEILDGFQVQNHGEYSRTQVLQGMGEYAKAVLNFILNASEDGIGGDPSMRIEMVGRNFFYETDKEGDHELDADKIINLYEFLQRKNKKE